MQLALICVEGDLVIEHRFPNIAFVDSLGHHKAILLQSFECVILWLDDVEIAKKNEVLTRLFAFSNIFRSFLEEL